jgi:hypothetical protein
MTFSEIAERHGVSESIVWSVWRSKTYLLTRYTRFCARR